MSASREKQVRKNTGFAPKTAREAQQHKEEQRTRLVYGAVGVALAVAVIASVVWNSNMISRRAVAATVDGEKYSAAQVSFYYRNAYVGFVNGWSYFLSYFGLDTSKPLADQKVSETAASFLDVDGEMTWQEYFMREGLKQIASVQNGLKQAKAENFVFPDSVQADFDEGMETLGRSARGTGSTVGRYLQNMFGSVMTEKVYRTELLRSLQFQAYAKAYEDGISYTQEELEAAYAENPQDYDQVAYELVTLDGSPAEPEAEEAAEEALEGEASAETGEAGTEEAAQAEDEAGTEEAAQAEGEAGAEEAEQAEAAAEEAEQAEGEASTEDAEAVEIADGEVPQASPEAVTAEDAAQAEAEETAEEANAEEAAAVEGETGAEEAAAVEGETGAEDAAAVEGETGAEDAATVEGETGAEEVPEETETPVEAGPELEAARANAQELWRAYQLVTSSGQDLSLQQLSTVYSNASYQALEDDTYENIGYTSETLRDWLYDNSRQDGDNVLLEDGNFVYVVVFHNRFRDEQKTVNVRHILIRPADATIEEGEEGYEAEQAQLQEAARTEAERILQEWRDGEATEDSFAALAKEYSQDNADDGGLYTQVKQGYMVDSFNDWIFDPARQSGDTDIVETTYGYHVMYFVGDDAPTWQAQVTENLKTKDYSDWSESLHETAVITREDFGMRFVV